MKRILKVQLKSRKSERDENIFSKVKIHPDQIIYFPTNLIACKFAAMETFVNKVAESGIITLNLESYLPKDVMIFDLKSFLFMELILKEKDYRAALLAFDWSIYQDKDVILTCTADAIIPVWAYMLAASYLQPVAKRLVMGDIEQAKKELLLQTINEIDFTQFQDARVVVKGCGDIPIPDQAYAMITYKLKPYVKSVMYGEPCSTVPIYKKKAI